MNRQAMMDTYNYYNDSRVQERMRDRAYALKELPGDRVLLIVADWLTEPDDDDDDADQDALEPSYEVALEYKVCWQCRGRGTEVNPSIDAGGLDEENAADPDFMDMYLGGAFDRECSTCRGKRVVPDHEAAMRLLPEGVRERLEQAQRDLDDDLAERISELRMGC